MKEIKVLEWNINQRGGFGKGEIPYWIKDEIEAANADIVVLTEFCTQCDGRINFINDLKNLGYHCVTSENFTGSDNKFTGNDILIGVKSPLKISCCFWVSCYDVNRDKKYYTIPENLFVDINCYGINLSVIGLRIKPLKYNSTRFKELQWVLNQVNNIKPVLITGDFNNFSRSYVKGPYNLTVIDGILEKNGYVRNTPDGSSWSEAVDDQDDHCYALDHFITKGISIKEGTLKYDRSFVYRDTKIYKWGTSFKAPCPQGEEPKDLSSIAPPFPDHAILKGTFILE